MSKPHCPRFKREMYNNHFLPKHRGRQIKPNGIWSWRAKGREEVGEKKGRGKGEPPLFFGAVFGFVYISTGV